jgi:hypothetical protein
MPSVRVSPGRLTALWAVLRALGKLDGSAPITDVRRLASRTSLRSGGLPIGDGMTLALEGTFAVKSGDRIELGHMGREALRLEQEDEPGPELRRMFLSVLLLRDPPAWVAFWQGDPSSIEFVIPDAERRLLADVGLYPESAASSLEGRAWWTALRHVPLPEEASEFRRVIGDAGEQLSLAFERQRLGAEGFPELARNVRWVAQESPAYGFDILSFRGKTYGGDALGHVAIEVKSTTRPAPEIFPFYLTAHEWAAVSEVGEDYVMHFWDGVDPGPPSRAKRTNPVMMLGTALAPHLPGPPTCGAQCRWESASLELPLTEILDSEVATP